jgi:hypothetical protein
MTSVQEAERTIKAIMFDGKQINWVIWEAKFGAKATKLGYFTILSGSDADVCVPKLNEEGLNYSEPGLDADGDPVVILTFNAAEMEEFAKWSLQAFMDLLLSIDTSGPLGRVAFDIIMGMKSPEYPNGNARLAWQRLKQKYAPTTAFALSTVYKKYAASKLRKGHDPDVFITYLQDLRM